MSTLWHGVAVQGPSLRCTLTEKDIVTGKMARERSVGDNKMIRSRLQKMPKNNTGSVGDEDEVAHTEERECVQKLVKNKSISICPFP